MRSFRHEPPRPPAPRPRLTRWAGRLDRLREHPGARWVSTAGRELAGILMPRICVVCQRRDATAEHLCHHCRQTVMPQLLHPERAESWAPSLPFIPGTDRPLPVVATGQYTRELARMILAFKDHSRTGLHRLLAPALARSMLVARDLVWDAVAQQYGTSATQLPVVAVPIPSSAASWRRRGFDPLDTLVTRAPVPGIIRQRQFLRHRWRLNARTSHAGRTAAQRVTAAERKFWVRHGIAQQLTGFPVMIVDDVLTTGATLAGATSSGSRGMGGARSSGDRYG